ncbi:MAG: hypothetical protein ACTHLL_02235, partial [Candidatus Nitrosocosmicus sp.]
MNLCSIFLFSILIFSIGFFPSYYNVNTNTSDNNHMLSFAIKDHSGIKDQIKRNLDETKTKVDIKKAENDGGKDKADISQKVNDNTEKVKDQIKKNLDEIKTKVDTKKADDKSNTQPDPKSDTKSSTITTATGKTPIVVP